MFPRQSSAAAAAFRLPALCVGKLTCDWAKNTSLKFGKPGWQQQLKQPVLCISAKQVQSYFLQIYFLRCRRRQLRTCSRYCHLEELFLKLPSHLASRRGHTQNCLLVKIQQLLCSAAASTQTYSNNNALATKLLQLR